MEWCFALPSLFSFYLPWDLRSAIGWDAPETIMMIFEVTDTCLVLVLFSCPSV